jgi:uncharacterized membrane protein YiaA
MRRIDRLLIRAGAWFGLRPLASVQAFGWACCAIATAVLFGGLWGAGDAGEPRWWAGVAAAIMLFGLVEVMRAVDYEHDR